ncbi:SLAIN motif-containing protein-like isoform X1 [Tachysurus fulvidraco]|uniref:SLAIN motif-containing protein-like isoform X1 n=1 Tax=Tachysurus fulvidraco TaxID=1234273 RepID=UPI000F4D7209|nr:SLAIN motif-containing protein-like isoform X1 [Tachysurus fulvidraco]XP_026991611.1 SLAIN motif-containing protein-like isoform X1 [Tachysurus fulvidraco]XP_026991612.1 SLAIN motif-containing protein-like isoform X1 [Tachysurus fulvidraco]XP_026991613.1 SLAIN motif-containing protein-like isoform X1 [Tachysurus fulvidraco]XP_026991614.1 SLAIN motif-containing protein-like isoform X1 [Tachysurus fulvidraco]
MVVPDSGSGAQQADMGTVSGFVDEQDGVELEEVRKLRELVRRLEVQNESLRNRGSTQHHNINDNERTLHEDTGTSSATDDQTLSPPQESVMKDMYPLSEATRLEDDEEMEQHSPVFNLPCVSAPGHTQEHTHTSSSPDSYDFETVCGSDAGVDQSALDEVDVLDLDDCADIGDEDCWLYVSPKKQVQTEQGPESPLKWCRKVLDHPSPETEVACRTLLNRLDQSSRWRNMYSSPSQTSAGSLAEAGSSHSPGYHKSTNKTLLTCGSSGYMSMHSALSSQSSIDSELSTSDDSISMGYKLQDLTDVQIMARLQEESLRQDYASSSASASRRSSAASLHSLRRGTYSDQELDSYSLEDEEADIMPYTHIHRRHSPSPGTSPRCPSPAAGTRVPRCSLQGMAPELLKFTRSEEELRHSMPNLAPRTSLRSLEAVRNSRSMEANLHSSGSRMSRLPQSPTGVSTTRLRGSGQSPLLLRAPVKALSPVGSMAAVRQSARANAGAQGHASGARRVQSPGPANGAAYGAGRTTSTAPKQAIGRSMTPTAAASSKSRLAQTPRSRSLGMTKTSGPMTDDSWKDGCY